MSLSREMLQPFVINYLRILKEFGLAEFDVNDVNHTLYVKWEWPAFIATLTPAGKRYTEFLRAKFAGQISVSDRQYFNLMYFPHVFVEVFDSYKYSEQKLGAPVRSLIIQFNRYLNEYVIQDVEWTADGLKTKNFQHIGFEELRYYISEILKKNHKDHILIRHLDELISPLCCWLEEYIDNSNPISFEELARRAPSLDRSLHMELNTVMSFGAGAYETSAEYIDVGRYWMSYHQQALILDQLSALRDQKKT